MKNIFDWLKEINYIKSPINKFTDKDWEVWNSYMIHRFLSMNPEFIELVNHVQEFPPQSKVAIYNIYKEFIPKNKKWNKYIKSNIKQHNIELLDYLSKYWECSKIETRDYLNILEDDQILNILTSIGLEKKEINKLLK